MKPPIEHEYSSCVAYTRDLELYTAWVEQKLAEAHPDPRVAELEAVLRECREELDRLSTCENGMQYRRVAAAIAKIDEVLK